MKVAQDLLELVQALSGLISEETLANFVPVLLRDLALEAAFLYLVQPCVNWGILLRIAKKTWWVLPGLEDGLEVEFFQFECVEHGGIGDKRAVYRKYRVVGVLSGFHRSSCAFLSTPRGCLTAKA
jgi:hypothetical protein